MYRPKAPPSIRLNNLFGVPDLENLHELYNQANHTRGRLVEVAWPNNEPPPNDCYLLQVVVNQNGGEPNWTLKNGATPRAPILWTHSTTDLEFLINVLKAQCEGACLEEAISNSQKFSQSAQKLGLTQTTDDSAATASGSVFRSDLPKKESVTFEGDLKDMQPASLLQSITFSSMTGRLVLNTSTEIIELFVEDGQPVHAQSRETEGDKAVLELLTWVQGKFMFYPAERTVSRSITRRLDSLLMEGMTLLDQNLFLTRSGLSMNSILVRKNSNITESEFEEAVEKAAPVDLNEQKRFYMNIDNVSSMFELMRRNPMSKPEWLPILFNLVSCDLVLVTDKPVHGNEQVNLESLVLDNNALQAALKVLRRAETGFVSYPLMLYFLEQEFLRYQAGGASFSLVVFELMLRTSRGVESLPNAALLEVIRRLDTIKRKIDVVGHYETFAYAMILPQTEANGAAVFVNQVMESLGNTTPGGDLDGANLLQAYGVASVPGDTMDLGVMLAGAIEAKERAKRTGAPIVLIRSVTG